jgi:hypothetical protein
MPSVGRPAYREATLRRRLRDEPIGVSGYGSYLLRAEDRRRSTARLVGEHLFHHLRDEDTITTTFVVVVVVCCCFLFRFFLGGY